MSRLWRWLGIAVVTTVATGMVGPVAFAESPTPSPGNSPTVAASVDKSDTSAAVVSPSPAATGLDIAAPDLLAHLDVRYPGSGALTTAATGKPLRLNLFNSGPATATDVTIRVDAGALNASRAALVRPPADAGCTVDSVTEYACPLPDVAPSVHNVYAYVWLKGLATGSAGTVTVTVTAANQDASTTDNRLTIPIQVVASQVDLAMEADDLDMVPGGTARLPGRVTNFGDVTAPGLRLIINLPGYVTVAKRHANCQYLPDIPVVCTFPEVRLAPGDVFQFSTATSLTIQLAKTAPGPGSFGLGMLEVHPISEPDVDADGWDNSTWFALFTTATNRPDPAAVAPKVVGRVGDTVPVHVGARNLGPADTPNPGPEPALRVTMTAPSGTTVVSTPAACATVTAGRTYRCEHSEVLSVGAVLLFDFRLKIDSDQVGHDGRVTIETSFSDANPANNTATLDVEVATSSLPITGTRPGTTAGGGTALLVIGILLLVAVRRRRGAFRHYSTFPNTMWRSPTRRRQRARRSFTQCFDVQAFGEEHPRHPGLP
jgi:hypothetical protein